VPKSEHTFIGGREDRIEDAPLGYYRFHFWINSDTAKLHENYVFVGKNAGFISISLMQEKDNRWRLLFRSALVSITDNEQSYYLLGMEINDLRLQKLEFEL